MSQGIPIPVSLPCGRENGRERLQCVLELTNMIEGSGYKRV